jgi:hypothetical protein
MRALWALLALSACGSDLVWYGHTSDRARRLEIRQQDGQQWLRTGERESARYYAIPTSALIRSPRGARVAFAAARRDTHGREHWHVVVDLQEGRAWDGVAGLRFDPLGRRVAYAAERGGRWQLVVDERAGPVFDSIDLDSLSFSPDGARHGYAALDGECVRVVIGHAIGSCRRAVRALAVGQSSADDIVITSDGDDPRRSTLLLGNEPRLLLEQPVQGLFTDPGRKHWAVRLGRDDRGRRPRLVKDGELLPEHDAIGQVVWAADGRTLAYTAREGNGWFAVVGAQRGATYRVVEAPVFSADGRHWGYIARSAARSHVVVDGRVRYRVPTPTATALAFSPDATKVAFVYRHRRGPVVVVGRDAFAFDVLVEGSLRFDRSGRHWALLAGELARRELFVVVDGRARVPFDATELFGGGLGAGDVAELLGRWVLAELERFLERDG